MSCLRHWRMGRPPGPQMPVFKPQSLRSFKGAKRRRFGAVPLGTGDLAAWIQSLTYGSMQCIVRSVCVCGGGGSRYVESCSRWQAQPNVCAPAMSAQSKCVQGSSSSKCKDAANRDQVCSQGCPTGTSCNHDTLLATLGSGALGYCTVSLPPCTCRCSVAVRQNQSGARSAGRKASH